jgi:hypothetical protein
MLVCSSMQHHAMSNVMQSIFHLKMYRGVWEQGGCIKFLFSPTLYTSSKHITSLKPAPVLYERLERIIITLEEFFCTDAIKREDLRRPNFIFQHTYTLLLSMERLARTEVITSLFELHL